MAFPYKERCGVTTRSHAQKSWSDCKGLVIVRYATAPVRQLESPGIVDDSAEERVSRLCRPPS